VSIKLECSPGNLDFPGAKRGVMSPPIDILRKLIIFFLKIKSKLLKLVDVFFSQLSDPGSFSGISS